jgi:hypothetical protein
MPRVGTANGHSRTTERLSVNVSAATAQALRELADAKATTVTEIVRQAVAVLSLLHREQAEGAELHLVSRSNSTVRVLHLI